MRLSTRTLPASLNSRWNGSVVAALIALATLTGCQNRAPSLRMLDTRAAYNADVDDEEVALYQRARHHPESIAQQGSSRIAKVFIYPHELPSRDYFWGGYVSMVVTKDEWVFEAPEDAVSEPPAAIREVPKRKVRSRKHSK
jgi:hypothetical protein